MAESNGEKSFDATPHRRQQAREKGQVVQSQDLASALMLLVGSALMLAFGGRLAHYLAALLETQLAAAPTLRASPEHFQGQGLAIAIGLATSLLPILGLLMLAGVLVNLLQTGPMLTPDRLNPDFSRLSPIKGFQRIFSLQGVMRLGFGVFKVLIVLSVAGAVLWGEQTRILEAGAMEFEPLAAFLCQVTVRTLLWVGFALALLALFDFAFQKWKHEQDLKMTHQELKEEMKNMQGDPQVAARRRQVHRQMVLSRIGTAVPKADVVVTNPTELAIAIQYDPETMAAPVVVAKGAGELAKRIRRLALENNVPVVERKPLARLLYKEVDINHPVPDGSYAAVAEVLAYVYQLKGKKPPRPRAA